MGGVVASLFCFCWIASLPAGAVAVRWASRQRGGIGSGSVLGIGIMTGTVLGLVVASLGTALFVASLDPTAMAEAAAMTESILGESNDVSVGMAAVGHAMLAFVVNLTFGVMGALLGAASVPPAQAEADPVPAPAPEYRFEPPAGWTPPAAQEPASTEEASLFPSEAPGEARAGVVATADAPDRPATAVSESVSPSEVEATAAQPSDEVPRDEVPKEALISAWTSTAVSGTPRPAVRQAPPADEEGPEDESPTLDEP